jgi:hypothetical protein
LLADVDCEKGRQHHGNDLDDRHYGDGDEGVPGVAVDGVHQFLTASLSTHRPEKEMN